MSFGTLQSFLHRRKDIITVSEPAVILLSSCVLAVLGRCIQENTERVDEAERGADLYRTFSYNTRIRNVSAEAARNA